LRGSGFISSLGGSGQTPTDPNRDPAVFGIYIFWQGENEVSDWSPSRSNSREKPMLRIRGYAPIGMVLILLACPAYAASDTRKTVEKTIPQCEDPPGTDEQTAPPAEHKGVIPPPPMGDEGIYTKVPNPEAGHEKEVIPPPGSPGGNPNVEPR
jgi:hypothetical protein